MQSRLGALRAALVAGSVAALVLVMWAPGAVAGRVGLDAPLTVVKTVSGPVPEGTTFTATIECDDDIIVDGSDIVDSVEVHFDATGQPTSQDTFGFDDPGTCTVTETDDGDAETTTYACESTLPPTDATAQQEDPDICSDAGPQSDPITVEIFDPDQTATVTIANTFVAPATTTTTTAPAAPQAAPAVVAPARFTG
jgi:hypothetical protein